MFPDWLLWVGFAVGTTFACLDISGRVFGDRWSPKVVIPVSLLAVILLT